MTRHLLRMTKTLWFVVLGGSVFAQGSNSGTTAATAGHAPSQGKDAPVASIIERPVHTGAAAPTHLAPVLNSIQIFDGDGLNNPMVGFTNARNILVVTGFADTTPDTLEITDDGFVTSTFLPYAQTLPFVISRTTDGPFVIQCRGLSSSGTSNEGYFDGTLDTKRPSGYFETVEFASGATNSPTATLRIRSSEPLNFPPDPTDPANFELMNCVLGQAVVASPLEYEYPVTHLANGRVEVRVLANRLVDRAGNTSIGSSVRNYLFDDEPPTAALSIPLVATGRDIHGIFTATDITYPYAPTASIPAIQSTHLYSRRPDSSWSFELFNKVSGDDYVFTPGGGVAGTYFMHFRAIDRAGNESSPIPTGMTGTGMVQIHYNPDPNAPVDNAVSGNGSYFFAMENDVLVQIDLAQVSGTGTLTVSRDEGDLGPFAGTGQMIHERLNISYTGFTFGSATLHTSYQDDNLDGANELSIVTAARVRSAADPTFFPITLDPTRNRITVNGITSLRDTWYFGRMSSDAGGWELYE
jgi:hypothetical protein